MRGRQRRPDRKRTAPGNLARHHDRSLERGLGRRRDRLRNPHPVGLLGAPVIARQHIAHRIAPSRLPDEAHRRASPRESPVRVLVLAEACVRGSDPDIGGKVNFMPQVPCVAMSDDHHGLRQMRG